MPGNIGGRTSSVREVDIRRRDLNLTEEEEAVKPRVSSEDGSRWSSSPRKARRASAGAIVGPEPIGKDLCSSVREELAQKDLGGAAVPPR